MNRKIILVLLLFLALLTATVSGWYSGLGERNPIEGVSVSDSFGAVNGTTPTNEGYGDKWVYGTLLDSVGNTAYLYHNSDYSNLEVGNETNELCYFQTLSGGSKARDVSCPVQPVNAVYPLDNIDVGWMPFDGAYNGTVNGDPQLVTGITGNAFDFDGSGDYFQVSRGSLVEPSGEMSIAYWMKTQSTANKQYIIDKGGGASNEGYFSLFDNNGNFGVKFCDGSSCVEPEIADTNINTGQWYCVVGTINSSDGVLYINGTQEANTGGLTIAHYSGDLFVGTDSYGGGNDANVILDDVRIYDHALTPSEVDQYCDNPQSLGNNEVEGETNNPPNQPTLNNPSDGATDTDLSVTLNVTVSDPDGDSMDVYFYDANTSNQIGSDSSVANNSYATTTWSNLNENTTYYWYANASDGANTTQSSTWSFTTKEVQWLQREIVNESSANFIMPLNATKTDIDLDSDGIVEYFYGLDGYLRYLESDSSQFNFSGGFGFQTQPDKILDGTPPSNLREYYALDENSGDGWGSINNYNLTAEGSGITQGASGKIHDSYDFAGTNNTYYHSNSSHLTINGESAITVLAWINCPNIGTGQAIVSKDKEYVFRIKGNEDDQLNVIVGDGSDWGTQYDGSADIADGSWHHVGIVWNGSNTKAVVDGSFVAQGDDGITSTGNGGTGFAIGDYQTGGSSDYEGKVDDVRIYDTALTEAEIQNIMDSRHTYLDPTTSGVDTLPSVSFESDTTNAGTYYDKQWIYGNVTASDDNSVQNVTIYLENETWSESHTDSTTPTQYSYNFTGLAFSNYTLKAWAYDNASQKSDNISRQITLESFKGDYNYSQEIQNSTSELLLPANGTSNVTLTSSDNWVYGIPYSPTEPSQNLLLWNTDTDVICGNSSQELCLVQTAPTQRKSCVIGFSDLNWGCQFDNDNAWDYVSNNNGTITGVTTGASGVIHNAYDADGVDDEIVVSDSSNLKPDNISISFWLKPDDTSATQHWIDKGEGAPELGYIVFTNTNGELRFRLHDGSTNYDLTTTDFSSGVWKHYVVVLNSTTYELYVNGSQVDSGSGFNIDHSTRDLHIMNDSYDGGLNANGSIDDLRIYSKSLTSKEVEELYIDSRFTESTPQYPQISNVAQSNQYVNPLGRERFGTTSEYKNVISYDVYNLTKSWLEYDIGDGQGFTKLTEVNYGNNSDSGSEAITGSYREAPEYVYFNDSYQRMYIGAQADEITMADSSDSTTFSNEQTVLAESDKDEDPEYIENETGTKFLITEDEYSDPPVTSAIYTSSDGVNWNYEKNIVKSGYEVQTPIVFWFNGKYRLFFEDTASTPHSMYLMNSTNLLDWSDPVLVADAGDFTIDGSSLTDLVFGTVDVDRNGMIHVYAHCTPDSWSTQYSAYLNSTSLTGSWNFTYEQPKFSQDIGRTNRSWNLYGINNNGDANVAIFDLEENDIENSHSESGWESSQFTFFRPQLPENTVVEWKICAENSLGNEVCSDVSSFEIKYEPCSDIGSDDTEDNTITVNPTGTCQVIQWAINNATTDMTLSLEPADYNEDITVDKNLDFISSGQDSVVGVNSISLTSDLNLTNIYIDTDSFNITSTSSVEHNNALIGINNTNISSLTYSLTDSANITKTTSYPANPSNWYDIGEYLDITGLSSDDWLDINITYSDSDISYQEDTLKFWKYNGSWYEDGWFSNQFLDTSNNLVGVNVTSTSSTFAPLETEDTSPPTFNNLSIENSTIVQDNGRPRALWMNTTKVSVEVSDQSSISSVTINLTSILGSGHDSDSMNYNSSSGKYELNVSATEGINETHSLTINATDEYGYSNTTTVTLEVLRRGDVNKDNSVSLADAVYIKRYDAGGYGEPYDSISTLVGDVNPATGDDSVSLSDAVYIKRYDTGGYGYLAP